ncbi:alpha/beta hydrolase [Sphingomonas sp.]|uniref:alpha/beta fold hydrolase n=1 Tax=Sphingomonas sp. TaxID=28214 RepID=UPI002DE3A318|nr:alpha/beta hydrolase [Sphingomonas sp.]
MIRHVLAAALATLTAPAIAQDAPTISPEAVRAYVAPAQLVEIGGKRRLNLVCMGEGDATVLFDAGGSDWSAIWGLVQPVVGKQARACAYDRAGLGHSDPARGPRTPVAIAEDLHALIEAAALKKPIVLVGHSLGGFNVKLHAALYPEDVAGLVLVDPSEERTWDRTREMVRQKYGERLAARSELIDHGALAGLVEHYVGCRAAALEKPLDPSSTQYKRCSDPVRPKLGPDVAAMRQKIQVTPAYQAAQASEIAYSIYGTDSADPVYARLFRPGALADIPIRVLTHDLGTPTDPLEALGVDQWLALHRESARLSRRGTQRIVPGTTHHIELDAPEAVVAAIAEVLAEIRASRKPTMQK